MRVLRVYRATAQRWHDCNQCGKPIWAGDEYEVEVCVDKKGLWVRKMHVFPPCEEPDDDASSQKGTAEIIHLRRREIRKAA